MGFFSRMMGGSTGADGGHDAYTPDMFGKWIEPSMPATSEQWERRLRAYSKKCARELTERGVERWRCPFPRGGKETYRDEFWLVAVDVERASHELWKNVQVSMPKRERGMPPQRKNGEWVGHMRGNALLLSRGGTPCVATVEGWLPTNGSFFAHNMDMIFTQIEYDSSYLKWRDWGYFNRGRWRPDRPPTTRMHGVEAIVMKKVFEGRGRDNHDDGRGTSSALSQFIKGNGRPQLPGGYDD